MDLRLRAAVSALLLAGAAGAEVDVEALVADLAGSDSARRSAAYTTLIGAKDPRAIKLIAKVAPTLDPYPQYQCVIILDSYPPEQTKSTWRALMLSKAPFIRMAAAEALYRRGERGTTKTLAGALRDPTATTEIKQRMMTRLMYGRAPAEETVAKAIRTYLDPAQPPVVICGAIQVIKGQPDPGARPAIEKLVADTRPGIRAVALAALYRDGDAGRAIPLADTLAGGKVPYHELWNTDLLLRDMRSVAGEIPAALTKLLATTTDTQILRGLIGFLERLKYRKAVPGLRKLVTHKDRSVSQLAARAVATLTGAAVPTPTGVNSLDGKDTVVLAGLIKKRDVGALTAWLKDPKVPRRLMAADALRRMDDPAGLPVVIAEMKDLKSKHHYEALDVLGKFVDPRAVDPLLDALGHEQSRVRQRAQYALQKLLTRLFPYRRITITTTGYSAYGDEAKRKKAIAVLRAWWEENRNKDW